MTFDNKKGLTWEVSLKYLAKNVEDHGTLKPVWG
jgi:hypothetical protein